jgi:bifunctional DNA-binding transcriptional regulator/antitoxin component of YhaV-PrlF toxin-antitoxin module
MTILTVTSKGQLSLRKDFLRHMGVRPGDKIALEKLPDGGVSVRAAQPQGQISEVCGLLKRPDGPSLSIDDMNELAAEGWAGRQ